MKHHMADIDQLEIAQMAVESSNYYLVNFQNLQNQKWKISWNWAAFFFGSIWFGYRKMYLPFSIILLGNITLFVYADYKQLHLYIDPLIILENIVLGMFGNALYFRALRKRKSRISKQPKLFRKMTGVNNWIFVIAPIMTILTVALIRLLVP